MALSSPQECGPRTVARKTTVIRIGLRLIGVKLAVYPPRRIDLILLGGCELRSCPHQPSQRIEASQMALSKTPSAIVICSLGELRTALERVRLNGSHGTSRACCETIATMEWAAALYFGLNRH